MCGCVVCGGVRWCRTVFVGLHGECQGVFVGTCFRLFWTFYNGAVDKSLFHDDFICLCTSRFPKVSKGRSVWAVTCTLQLVKLFAAVDFHLG